MSHFHFSLHITVLIILIIIFISLMRHNRRIKRLENIKKMHKAKQENMKNPSQKNQDMDYENKINKIFLNRENSGDSVENPKDNAVWFRNYWDYVYGTRHTFKDNKRAYLENPENCLSCYKN